MLGNELSLAVQHPKTMYLHEKAQQHYTYAYERNCDGYERFKFSKVLASKDEKGVWRIDKTQREFFVDITGEEYKPTIVGMVEPYVTDWAPTFASQRDLEATGPVDGAVIYARELDTEVWETLLVLAEKLELDADETLAPRAKVVCEEAKRNRMGMGDDEMAGF